MSPRSFSYMLTIKVPLPEAQKVKKYLLENDYFAVGYRVIKEDDYLYFPVTGRFDGLSHAFVQRDVDERVRPQVSSLKEALAKKVPAVVLEELKTAYDTVGDIAILEIDEEHRSYEQVIGEALLANNPKITTVLAKDAHHEGVFRTQKMRHVAGVDKREAQHKENGVILTVDVEEVYYSSRLSTERKRIMELVRPGEKILVMFSGCGPYTCVLAKNTSASLVVGVEINPVGHALAQRNIAANKIAGKAVTYNGDVREVVVSRVVAEHGLFDRVLMPLPKSAETFLDVALAAVNVEKGAMVHFYAFLHEDEKDQALEWISQACAAADVSHEVQAVVRCGQQAPHVYRWCVDFTVRH